MNDARLTIPAPADDCRIGVVAAPVAALGGRGPDGCGCAAEPRLNTKLGLEPEGGDSRFDPRVWTPRVSAVGPLRSSEELDEQAPSAAHLRCRGNVEDGRSAFSASDERNLDAIVFGYMETQHIPNGSLAVVSPDGRLVHCKAYTCCSAFPTGTDFSKSFGCPDSDDPFVANVHTRFRMASVSKTVTAVAIMSLIEEGAFGASGGFGTASLTHSGERLRAGLGQTAHEGSSFQPRLAAGSPDAADRLHSSGAHGCLANADGTVDKPGHIGGSSMSKLHRFGTTDGTAAGASYYHVFNRRDSANESAFITILEAFLGRFGASVSWGTGDLFGAL